MVRFDFLFSYWIFAWYLVYIAGWTPYNPTFALGIAILQNLTLLFSMHKTQPYTIFLFILAMFLFKILPFISITHRIQPKDVLASILLFLGYVGWLCLNGLSPLYPLRIYSDIVQNKQDLPFTSWAKKLIRA
jgi:hypothetical protein